MRRLWPRDPAPWLFDLAALVLVVWSTVVLVQASRHLGETYGGFIWVHDPTLDPPYYVGFFPWRSIRSDPARLQGLDHLVSIQGAPPDAYPQIYAALPPGVPVRYTIHRGRTQMEIVEPTRVLVLSDFLAIFGLPYLLILSALGAGRVLAHSTKPYRRVLAWITLAAAGGLFHAVWAQNSFEGPQIIVSYAFPIMAMPVPGIGGALVLHSVLLYPRPGPLLRRHARAFPFLLYLPPWTLGLASLWIRLAWPAGRMVQHKAWSDALIFGEMGYGMVCLILAMAYMAGRLPRLRRAWTRAEWEAARSLLVIVGWLLAGLVGLWWAPVLWTGFPLVPYEVLVAMGVVFPLGMAYGLRNGDLLATAERAAQEAAALYRTREQMLHRIADQIHDRILPDLQGVRMVVEGLPVADAQVRRDRDQAVRVLRRLVEEMRVLLDTTKPMDWSRQRLDEAFAWLVQRMAQFHPQVTIHLSTEGYDEADPPRVKEAIYHVMLAGLNNALDHSRAGQVWIRLWVADGAVHLEVADDGVGFDPAQVTPLSSGRRHMGLETMRAHAQEVGGSLAVESRPNAGTRIHLRIPREEVAHVPEDGSS